jgi:hypothetical protein
MLRLLSKEIKPMKIHSSNIMLDNRTKDTPHEAEIMTAPERFGYFTGGGTTQQHQNSKKLDNPGVGNVTARFL